jgi:3'5'-cyclic nucleotide phosphodiesterase
MGVSNAQLVKENDRLARIYKNQSVAEQNSLNLAWDLLMDPSFSELRKSIYNTEEEYNLFRSMLTNTVMAVRRCLHDAFEDGNPYLTFCWFV